MRRGAGLFLLLGFGCASPPGEALPGSASQPIVYGEDDRTEAFDTDDIVLRAFAEETAVALVRRSDIELGADGIARLLVPSLGQKDRLCPSERFLDQPAAAFCSGTLVADDLVLTAGHCLDAVPCSSLVAVFGYYYEAPGVLHRIENADVVDCEEVTAKHVELPSNATQTDYAWFRLAKPRTASRSVPALRDKVALAPDSAVATVGFGSGIPAKVDTSGVVRDSRAETLDYFVTNLDAFHGASGSAVYDAAYRLVGILGRGGDDLRPTDEDCFITFEDEDLPNLAREQATYAFRAFDGLCEGHADPRLCPSATDDPRNPGVDAGCSTASGPDRRRTSVWTALLFVGLTLLRRRHAR